ncbi:MAG: DeoR family transcriptional regulator [Sterolibacterium sp.]|jgi:DeoR family glycerol-3-phosphate regulon repressor
MDLNERQEELLGLVRQEGYVSVDDLAQRFDVTTQTIRRDINQLAEQNLLRRYHGGAGLPSSIENIAYTQRQVQNSAEKERIAALVASQIPNDTSLILNIGTTTEAVAKALYNHRGLRVVTNNLNVAAILAGNPDNEIIVVGGMVRSVDRGIIGEATMDFIRQFKVDIGIIGVSSIEPDGTLRYFDYREVKVAQTIIGQSRKTWLVVDHSKFGRDAMVRFGDLSQIDAIFTDAPPPPAMKAVLREAGTVVHVAA